MILEYRGNITFRVFISTTEKIMRKYPKESSAYISYDNETGDLGDSGMMKHKSVLENIKYNVLVVVSDDDLEMERTKICLITGEVIGADIKSNK